jgi:hypothetical protein
MISKSASTQFFLTIYESTGVECANKPSASSASSFIDDFLIGIDSDFLYYF